MDAAARRVHNENRYRFILAGGKPEDWTDYEGAGEALDEEAIERALEANPLIHRVTG